MLTAQIARLLAALGKKVVIADFDFDAPGISAVFGKSIEDIENKEGLFELYTKSINNSISDKKFKGYLKKCMINVEIKLKGARNTGSIQILRSGCIKKNNRDYNYWNEISKPMWLTKLSASKQTPDSFLRFVLKKLKPTLESMKIHYLLIDARSGITYYGNIAQYVANCQVMVFCPNKEAKEALRFLLPALENSQEKRQEAHKNDTDCGINPNEFPLDKVIFVVSRMPPELNEQKEKVFKNIEDLIKANLSKKFLDCTKVLKLHSDLDIHLDSQCRNFDERYLKRKLKNVEIVQIHEDILMILATLCDELHSDLSLDDGLDEPLSYALWKKIYSYKFEITRENRLFGSLYSGEMRNPDDDRRNVAFKVDTFLGFLNSFFKTLKNYKLGNYKEIMKGTLYNAGENCGKAFGKALAKQWLCENKQYNQIQKITKWCEFDTRAGFGKMTFYEHNKLIEVKNLFILNSEIAKKREYDVFFKGYINGVLTELLEKQVKLKKQDKVSCALVEKNVIKYEIEMED